MARDACVAIDSGAARAHSCPLARLPLGWTFGVAGPHNGAFVYGQSTGGGIQVAHGNEVDGLAETLLFSLGVTTRTKYGNSSSEESMDALAPFEMTGMHEDGLIIHEAIPRSSPSGRWPRLRVRSAPGILRRIPVTR